jgi:hypothetical protein
VYAAGAIAKGDLVYVSAWNEANACPEVSLARANAAATMPAIGIADAAINANEVGEVYSAGVVTGLNTNAHSAGTRLYVSSATAGAWTSTRPVGPNIEQKIGIVGAQNASTGTVFVNLGSTHEFSAADKFWYGGTAGVVTEGSITAAGRAILDDANAAAQLTTLGAIPDPATPEQGDVLCWSGSAWVRLAHGTSGQALITKGHAANPEWGDVAGGSTPLRRHAWADPNSYCGMAVAGSAESDHVWDITRIAVAADGSTTHLYAVDVGWDDRVGAAYA